MSEGISPAPVDGDYVVKPAQEPIQIPAENPPGDCSEVAERIMGELKALGVDRIETHEFVSGRPNFIIQAGEGARAIRPFMENGTPGIFFGPGEFISEAHLPNERVPAQNPIGAARMVCNGEPFQGALAGRSGEGFLGVVLTAAEKMYIIHSKLNAQNTFDPAQYPGNF